MKRSEAALLPDGLYEIYWKTGGSSLAAVGTSESGNRWFAPANWVNVPWFRWSMIRSVRKIAVRKKHVTGCSGRSCDAYLAGK